MSMNGVNARWLDETALDLLDRADAVARRFAQRYYRGPQILLAFAKAGGLDLAAERLGLEPKGLIESLSRIVSDATSRWAVAPDSALDPALAKEFDTLARQAERPLAAADILALILGGGAGMRSNEFARLPIDAEELNGELARILRETGQTHNKNGTQSRATVNCLSRYGTAAMASDARILFDNRSDEVRRLGEVLGRLWRPNLLVIGRPGVGKSSAVHALEAWISSDEAPPWLCGVSIHSVSCADLVSGAGYRGQVEERLQEILDAALLQRSVIPFFDDLHALGDPTAAGTSKLLGMLGAYLNRHPGLRVIAATDTKGFEIHVRPRAELLRRFETVSLAEPGAEQTVRMLRSHASTFGDHYGFSADDTTLREVVEKCERFLPQRRFPEKAVSLLDAAMQLSRAAGRNQIVREDVLEVVSRETDIPVGRLSEMEQARLRGLAARLDARVFDQHTATTVVSHAIQSMRLGLQDPRRAGSSFLLIGPPGTGKTELAKAVAECLMGSEKALLRFNMSEFQTPESHQRLLGPPPGYVGFEAGGELTNRLMENPYSVVLLDEIEKGSSGVFDVCLQILSDGYLTDNHGNVVDCKNAIFLMTSNALVDVSELSDVEIRDQLLEFCDPHRARALGPTFRREFIDRLEVVPFRALGPATLRRILDQEVRRVVDQFNKSPHSTSEISVDGALTKWLVARVEAETTGARGVQRLVESAVSRVVSGWFVEEMSKRVGRYVLTIGDGHEGPRLIEEKETIS